MSARLNRIKYPREKKTENIKFSWPNQLLFIKRIVDRKTENAAIQVPDENKTETQSISNMERKDQGPRDDKPASGALDALRLESKNTYERARGSNNRPGEPRATTGLGKIKSKLCGLRAGQIRGCTQKTQESALRGQR